MTITIDYFIARLLTLLKLQKLWGILNARFSLSKYVNRNYSNHILNNLNININGVLNLIFLRRLYLRNFNYQL